MPTTTAELLKKASLDLWDETIQEHKGIYLDEGGNFSVTLSQLNAQLVSIPIGKKCATLAAQIEHVIYYLEILELYATEQPIPTLDWARVWNTVEGFTDQEWNDARERLFAVFARVRNLIESADFDNENVIEGVLGIITHTAYHLGQIHQSMCVLPGDPRNA